MASYPRPNYEWGMKKEIMISRPKKSVTCGKEEELVDHLLLQCEVAAKCLCYVQGKLGWLGTWSLSLVDFFLSWPRMRKRNTLESVWRISPSIVIWEVWKERNRRIF